MNAPTVPPFVVTLEIRLDPTHVHLDTIPFSLPLKRNPAGDWWARISTVGYLLGYSDDGRRLTKAVTTPAGKWRPHCEGRWQDVDGEPYLRLDALVDLLPWLRPEGRCGVRDAMVEAIRQSGLADQDAAYQMAAAAERDLTACQEKARTLQARLDAHCANLTAPMVTLPVPYGPPWWQEGESTHLRIRRTVPRDGGLMVAVEAWPVQGSPVASQHKIKAVVEEVLLAGEQVATLTRERDEARKALADLTAGKVGAEEYVVARYEAGERQRERDEALRALQSIADLAPGAHDGTPAGIVQHLKTHLSMGSIRARQQQEHLQEARARIAALEQARDEWKDAAEKRGRYAATLEAQVPVWQKRDRWEDLPDGRVWLEVEWRTGVADFNDVRAEPAEVFLSCNEVTIGGDCYLLRRDGLYDSERPDTLAAHVPRWAPCPTPREPDATPTPTRPARDLLCGQGHGVRIPRMDPEVEARLEAEARECFSGEETARQEGAEGLAPIPPGSLWQHADGGRYVVVGTGLVQMETDVWATAVVYRNPKSDPLFTRTKDRFLERMTPIEDVPPADAPNYSEKLNGSDPASDADSEPSGISGELPPPLRATLCRLLSEAGLPGCWSDEAIEDGLTRLVQDRPSVEQVRLKLAELEGACQQARHELQGKPREYR